MNPFDCMRLLAIAGPTNVSAKIHRLVPFPRATEYAPSAPSQPCWQGKYAAEAHPALAGGGGTELVCEPPQESTMLASRKWLTTNATGPVFIAISLRHFRSVPIRGGEITSPHLLSGRLRRGTSREPGATATASDQNMILSENCSWRAVPVPTRLEFSLAMVSPIEPN